MGRYKEHGFSICKDFDLKPTLPEITDKDAMLALALIREGRGINHAGYAFLSVLSRTRSRAPINDKETHRVDLPGASLANLTGHGVEGGARRLKDQKARKASTDVGKHLYELGRCAMAHANRQPIIDPDKPDHMRRLNSELPIMRVLAVKAIEEVFGVETRRRLRFISLRAATVWQA